MSIVNLSNEELNQVSFVRPSPDEVDQLADELVSEFTNPDWRPWYCRQIIRLGTDRVRRYQVASRKGRKPAHLFSHYLTHAKVLNSPELAAVTPQATTNKVSHSNAVQAAIDEMVGHAAEAVTSGTDPKAMPWLRDE
jgi:hypothetical protein